MGVLDSLGNVGSSFLDTGLNLATFGGYGATQSSDAAQRMAQDQQSTATSQQQQALGYAEMTPQEMQNLQDQLDHLSKMNEIFGQQITNSASVLAAVNPAYISAGQNAVDIMNGKSAPTLGPLQQQIDQQRQNLQGQLAAMYGPGWASSSAGIEAMQRFEQGAQSTIANAQQSYLGTLLGGATQGAQVNESAMNNGARTMGDLFSQAQGVMGSYNKLKVDASMGTNPTQFMGASNLGAMRSGQFFSQQGQFLDTLPLALMKNSNIQQTQGGGGGGGFGGMGVDGNFNSIGGSGGGGGGGGASPFGLPANAGATDLAGGAAVA